MESKIPDWFFTFYEKLISAQLRAIRELKSPKLKRPKRTEPKGMSNIDMVLDVLRKAQKPLHISQILAEVKAQYGVTLDRESLVSALVKKVHRRQGLSRTAPNTFKIEMEGEVE